VDEDGHATFMSVTLSALPRPATSLVRMLVGEVKVVGTLPEGAVLLCGNHVSYRDVFLFGMVRASARLLVHPLVFSFPFLKKYALRWGFVQVDLDVAAEAFAIDHDFGAQEVWACAAVPIARVDNLDCRAGGRGHRAADFA
jgi:1-acyl-sn-glycerol-3-phosphate acyltransferase